ncbi:midkine a [Myripristis murdjan]|uniref:midkine a n=1 Tax=Myripristis murdjan TaxID=586833 RepID=UPI0011761FB0|nr:midkine-B-like [Myripristis murdjan]
MQYLSITSRMRAVLLLLLMSLLAVNTVAAGGKNRKEKVKPPKSGTECTDWRYGNCVPSNGDCGVGFRQGSCDQQTRKMKCKVPCNWKKDFGADCKYRFGSWGECDPSSGSRIRVGMLKKALYNAECQQTISVSKPCPGKTKTKTKGKKGRGKEN